MKGTKPSRSEIKSMLKEAIKEIDADNPSRASSLIMTAYDDLLQPCNRKSIGLSAFLNGLEPVPRTQAS